MDYSLLSFLGTGDLALNIRNLAVFIFAIFCFNLTPGPDFLLLIRTTVKNGPWQAWKVIAGICTSTTVWNLVAVVGLSAILMHSPKGVLTIKILGALYLIYLGGKSLYSALQTSPTEEDIKSNDRAGFKEGFFADFLEPATGFFALTFFPQFVMHGYNPTSYMLLLTVVQDIAIVVSYGGLVLLTCKGPMILRHPRMMKSFDIIAGCLFIYFAIKLLMEVY